MRLDRKQTTKKKKKNDGHLRNNKKKEMSTTPASKSEFNLLLSLLPILNKFKKIILSKK